MLIAQGRTAADPTCQLIHLNLGARRVYADIPMTPSETQPDTVSLLRVLSANQSCASVERYATVVSALQRYVLSVFSMHL